MKRPALIVALVATVLLQAPLSNLHVSLFLDPDLPEVAVLVDVADCEMVGILVCGQMDCHAGHCIFLPAIAALMTGENPKPKLVVAVHEPFVPRDPDRTVPYRPPIAA